MNRLLAALPDDVRERLLAELEPVELPLRRPLHEPDQPITHVYFPLTCLVSLLVVLEDGSAVESAMIGNEGMVGLPVFLGQEADSNRALVQVPGVALRLSAPALRAAVDREPALQSVLQRFTLALLSQMSQSAACNRMHPIDERCARWMLQTGDRVGSDDFPLTQEFLASMLGVRRPSVTTAAGMLQQAGFIRYHRGRVTILDRPSLEAAACECYRAITGFVEQLNRTLLPQV